MPQDALPAPGDDYFEYECAKAHGGWALWVDLPVDVKGRLIAHDLEKNMRDSYHLSRQKPKTDPDGPANNRTVMDSIRERFFSKPASATIKKK